MNGYQCPMHPQIHQSTAGHCPICGLPLESHTIFNKNTYFDPLWIRFWLASLLTVVEAFIYFFPEGLEHELHIQWLHILEWLVTSIIIWGAGWEIQKKCFLSFFNRKWNAYTLIGLGIFIPYIYSTICLALPESHYYFVVSAVVTSVILLGLFLQSRFASFAAHKLEELPSPPQYTYLVLGPEEERKIALEDVKKGDTLRIKPGEKIPADGHITEGQSWINESRLTGETIPLFKRPNDKVFAGTLNGNGSFLMLADLIGDETLSSKVIKILTEESIVLAPYQRKVYQFVQILIPLIILAALLTGLGWVVFKGSWDAAIIHASAICSFTAIFAMYLAIDLPFTLGMQAAISHGLIIKDAEALENALKVNTLVLDKAGTLTEGKPLLTKVFARYPYTEAEVLKLGANAELGNDHPVAQAIITGAKLKHISLQKASHFQNLNSKGVIAREDGTRVAVGNLKLMEELEVDCSSLIPACEKWQKEGLTVIYVAVEYRAVGLLAVSDPIRFTAERAIHQLHQENLKIVMATGDSKEAASAIGKQLQIDTIASEVLPQDKMALIQKLQNEGNIVAMAGDPRTDMPAIAQANLGIAMGIHTHEDELSTSITLFKGDLRGIVRLIALSKAVLNNARQNWMGVMIYHFICLALVISGVLGHLINLSLLPILAAFSMICCTLAVIGNALRLRNLKLFD